MEKERAIFLNAYANVPEPLRKDTIVLIEKEPYSWETAYFEIKKETELGKKILKTLKQMEILG
ncbi:MAG: hypothetical protein KKF50_01250 [Nanoarchaeota archaeon]|nr:hypothetical protein [Nanoarchaeota archaeon]